jgi:hypothetical protein
MAMLWLQVEKQILRCAQDDNILRMTMFAPDHELLEVTRFPQDDTASEVSVLKAQED